MLLAFGAVVALALLSLGTLISILLAAVLAFGLDPVVGNLVRRGWKRGPASLAVFAGRVRGLRRARGRDRRAGVGGDRRVRQRAAGHVGRADLQAGASRTSSPRPTPTTRSQPAQGARRRAAGRRQRAARDRRRDLRLGPVARDPDLPRAVPADGAADDHEVAVRVHAARDRGALAPGGRGVDPRDLDLADRQPRDLGRRRDRGRRLGRCCWTCRSRSCWP